MKKQIRCVDCNKKLDNQDHVSAIWAGKHNAFCWDCYISSAEFCELDADRIALLIKISSEGLCEAKHNYDKRTLPKFVVKIRRQINAMQKSFSDLESAAQTK